jgi:Mrp family chromosome partitioning ATPase
LNPLFDNLLARLRERFDYVIIDSSPVFAADDSSTLAPKVDGTLFVVRSRYSNARAVREALNLLFQRQARVLGLILNRADTASRSYYAYKYAEYYASASKAAAEAEEKT